PRRRQIPKEVVLGEQVSRRVLHQTHEIVQVHGQLGLPEVPDDLLQPPTLPDADGELDPLLLAEGGHDGRWRQGRRQVVGPCLKRPLPPGGDDVVLESELAPNESLLEEQVPYLRVAGTRRYLERDPGHAVARRGVGNRRRLIPAHEVEDDPLLDGARVGLDPRHQPGGEGQEPDKDEEGRQRGDRRKPEEQDDGLEAPPGTPFGGSPLCPELANALIAASVILPAGTRLIVHPASWWSGASTPARGGRLASR